MRNVQCSLCGAKTVTAFKARDYLSGEFFDIERCSQCSLLATRLKDKQTTAGTYYTSEYFGRRRSFVNSFVLSARFKKIKNLIKQSGKISLLDVGCGSGDFLRLVKKKKRWNVIGTETSRQRIEDCQKNGITVIEGGVSKDMFAPRSFDIITLWHVLEHVFDPQALLGVAHVLLKDNGWLVIEVPNIDSWQAHFSKDRWFHLDVPRHLYHFSPRTLQLFLEKAGFSVKKMKQSSFFYDVFGSMQSALNMVVYRQNFLFDLLNRKVGFKMIFSKYFGDTIITIILTIPIFIFSIFLYIFAFPHKKRGIILVYAQKK